MMQMLLSLCTKPFFCYRWMNDSVGIKISGDGVQFSKTSKFTLLSFSLPFPFNDALSGYGLLQTYVVSSAQKC